MRHDLDILAALFLPAMEEIAAHSARLADELAQGMPFWAGFNGVLLAHAGGPGSWLTWLADRNAPTPEHYAAYFDTLKAEYIYNLAALYVSGDVNPGAERMRWAGDAAFAEHVAFQRDMLAAIRALGRAELKTELGAAADAFEVSGQDIAAAFGSMERERLKDMMRQWEPAEQPQPAPAEKKKRGRKALPFVFFRFAAAAAVCAVATVGVIKVRHTMRNDAAPAGHYRVDTNTGASTRGADTITDGNAKTDSIAQAGTRIPEVAASRNEGQDTAGVWPGKFTRVRLPRIVLSGIVVDSSTNEIVPGVTVIMDDDAGSTQTLLSNDGGFHFNLPWGRDVVITGKIAGYTSARLSMSTKGIKENDADDTVGVVLRLIKDK